MLRIRPVSSQHLLILSVVAILSAVLLAVLRADVALSSSLGTAGVVTIYTAAQAKKHNQRASELLDETQSLRLDKKRLVRTLEQTRAGMK